MTLIVIILFLRLEFSIEKMIFHEIRIEFDPQSNYIFIFKKKFKLNYKINEPFESFLRILFFLFHD